MKAPADGWDREERESIDELRDELWALQARHQDDPGFDLLRAARHDALPSDLQSDADNRLLTDPWSRALVEGLDDVEPAFDKNAEDRLLARIHRDARGGGVAATRATRPRAILASAALVTCVVSAWILFRSGSPSSNESPVVREQPAASTPLRPSVQLPLDKPDVTISLAALTWRGERQQPKGDGRGGNALLADLKAPLDAFRAGDYVRADREFTTLESKYPRAIEVFFYGGVSRLFVNEPVRARAALMRASELADTTFASRTAWYLAIAELRAGEVAPARARLDELCRGTSDRAAHACEAVKQIDAAPGTRGR